MKSRVKIIQNICIRNCIRMYFLVETSISAQVLQTLRMHSLSLPLIEYLTIFTDRFSRLNLSSSVFLPFILSCYAFVSKAEESLRLSDLVFISNVKYLSRAIVSFNLF